jgi:hypothetical protein
MEFKDLAFKLFERFVSDIGEVSLSTTKVALLLLQVYHLVLEHNHGPFWVHFIPQVIASSSGLFRVSMFDLCVEID